MPAVDPHSYYGAASTCYELSRAYQAAFNPLQSALYETGGMAGEYAAAHAWAESYDKHAADCVLAVTELARAAQNLGDIFTASGYNWDCSNYAANRDPNKGSGPGCPTSIPTQLPYGSSVALGVASSSKNSTGLASDYPELLTKAAGLTAGGEIPDGNTDKLSAAADAWTAFANHEALNDGIATLTNLAHHIGFNDSPDIANLTGHISTLSKSARDIRLTANDIAKSVDQHHVALAAFRTSVNNNVTAILVGSSVAIGAVLVSIVGAGRAATAAPATIDTAASAIAGFAGTFISTLGGLTISTEALATAGLVAITGLSIVSIAGDASFNANNKPPANAYDPNGPKAPGRPGDAEGFKPPKGGDRWSPSPNPRPGGRKMGWEDANGNVWIPTGHDGSAHGGPHWDVQKKSGGYENVLPGGGRR